MDSYSSSVILFFVLWLPPFQLLGLDASFMVPLSGLLPDSRALSSDKGRVSVSCDWKSKPLGALPGCHLF